MAKTYESQIPNHNNIKFQNTEEAISTRDMAEGVYILYSLHSAILPCLNNNGIWASEKESGSNVVMISESLCMLGSLTIELSLKDVLKGILGVGTHKKPKYPQEFKHEIHNILRNMKNHKNKKVRAVFHDLNRFFEHNRKLNARFKKKKKDYDIIKFAKAGLRSFEPGYRHRGDKATPDASLVVIILKFLEFRGYLSVAKPRVFDVRYVKLSEITDYKKKVKNNNKELT